MMNPGVAGDEKVRRSREIQAVVMRYGARLCIVGKTWPMAALEGLRGAGFEDFGENRVQEATWKWGDRLEWSPGVRLHMIGRWQTNKINAVCALFDWVHSLDRVELVEKISRRKDQMTRLPSMLVQVNLGGEDQKGGVAWEDAPILIEKALKAQLPLVGLMGVPPLGAEAGPLYRRLRRLVDQYWLNECSMGMSGDWRLALDCGATVVRVGSAILGSREEQ